jgi:hypothetical protein
LQLARSKHGTIIYESGPQKAFVISSFMAGIVCIGAAGLNLHFNVFNLPPGVPAWTSYAFGTLGLVLAILGTNFAMMPSGAVRMIKVLPAAVVSATTTAATYGPPKVQLEVLARRMAPIPFLPLKRYVVEPQELVMKSRMYNPPPSSSEMDKHRMTQEWAQRRKAQKEYDDNHRMTVPFRDAKWAISTIFGSIRSSVTGEGFAPLEVQGYKYKMDITNAYALDEGKALDRIVRIEPDKQMAALLSKVSQAE